MSSSDIDLEFDVDDDEYNTFLGQDDVETKTTLTSSPQARSLATPTVDQSSNNTKTALNSPESADKRQVVQPGPSSKQQSNLKIVIINFLLPFRMC